MAKAWRNVALFLAVLLAVGAGITAPNFVAAADPQATPGPSGPAPTTQPTSSPEPSPSQPTTSPSPSTDPIGPGVELVDHRTAYSQTFAQPDGTWQIEEFADPVNYQPDGSAEWQPIDLRFGQPIVDGATTSVSASPSRLSLFSADNAAGFLRLDGHDGQSISFGLPEGTTLGSQRPTAQVVGDGAYAEYPDFLAGGIGLRVFPHADGFTSFLVIPARPQSNVFTFTVSSDMSLSANEDGSRSFRDAEGNEAGRLPKPYLVDSSDLEGRGGGLYSEAVTMDVTPDGPQHTMTLTVDPAYLDRAIYPIYLDPSTTTFPGGCSCTSNDTMASSKYPGTNFNMYQRPDSPFYNEMWHGNEPGTSYYNEVYIRFNDLEATLGSTHIDSAYLKLYPYHQYTSPKESGVDRMADGSAGDWGAGTLTWNLKPALDTAWTEVVANTSQGTYSSFDVTSAVQDVVNGAFDNNGFMVHATTTGQGGWKRFISGNDSSSNKPKLVVTVTPFGDPSVVYPNSTTGETSSRTMTWSLPVGAAQGAYDLQVDQSKTSPWDYDSGTVTSSVTGGMVPTSTTLTEGQTYFWRVKVKYGNNTGFSNFSSWGQFIYHQGATLGLPDFDSFEFFDLGTGDGAAVNTTTGNLAISHPIVSLPIQGSTVSLGLTYNSEATANSGMGAGWRLNATRRLTELGNGDVVFTAGDGSVHTFTKGTPSGTVTPYTRPSTIYGTLVKDTSHTLEWTLTYRDQSVDSFDASGSEGLLAKQTDRFGNAVTFSYTASTNRLSQATDPNGRVVDFAWNTGASPAQLTSITDWAYVSSGVVQSTNTGARRQYRFFYDGSGRLIGWSNPMNTSGSCTTGGTNLTCLTYGSNGLVATIAKTQTYTTVSAGSLGTSTRAVTTTFTYRGGEVAQVQDPEQTSSSATTLTRTATDKMQVVRRGSATSTTTYQFVAPADNLGRVQSILRLLSGTNVEQRTTWDATYPTERASVTDAYGTSLARQVLYAYQTSSMGLLSKVTEPLTASANRITDYIYNANNDVTEMDISLDESSSDRTVTRYCYGNSTCATTDHDKRRSVRHHRFSDRQDQRRSRRHTGRDRCLLLLRWLWKNRRGHLAPDKAARVDSDRQSRANTQLCSRDEGRGAGPSEDSTFRQVLYDPRIFPDHVGSTLS